MKKTFIICLFLVSGFSLYAQDYPQWPADKPETGFIEESQSRQIRLGNDILPQEIDMQDRMRTLFTNMMKSASKKLGWPMVELSEYTNDNTMQGAGTPYALRSPRGILITFQFIVNNDSLQAWKNYQTAYNNLYQNKMQSGYDNTQATMQSPLYKQYRDSANYYMNLYTNYIQAHQSEGAALYTADKHPKYYQQKEMKFLDKANALTNQANDKAKVKETEDEGKLETIRFRNHTIVQVEFRANATPGVPFAQSHFSTNIKSTYVPYAKTGAKISNLYTAKKETVDKWQHSILILLGNFLYKKDQYGDYPAGFNLNGQDDEDTPKKIKSDKVQNIAVNIYGDKNNIEKMAKLIDTEKLNSVIVKN